jgi:hypothetical protein
MNDLLNLKLGADRAPVQKTVELDGKEYTGHFLPLMRSEFSRIQKSPEPDDQLIYESWVNPDGSKCLQSPDQAGEFPVKAYNALVQAALEVSGFGKRAHSEAKKD